MDDDMNDDEEHCCVLLQPSFEKLEQPLRFFLFRIHKEFHIVGEQGRQRQVLPQGRKKTLGGGNLNRCFIYVSRFVSLSREPNKKKGE